MYKFSNTSKENLSTVHPDLQTLFQEVIKHRDCAIVSGKRTKEEQAELYKKGRSTSGEIVTYRDGVFKKSKHQSGNAVDVVPYPEKWNEEAIRDFGNYVKGIAIMLKAYGAIDKDIQWGGDWERSDKPHWQV